DSPTFDDLPYVDNNFDTLEGITLPDDHTALRLLLKTFRLLMAPTGQVITSASLPKVPADENCSELTIGVAPSRLFPEPRCSEAPFPVTLLATGQPFSAVPCQQSALLSNRH
ncbi:hypothetical protein TYRP_020818, partial [Tyrophagus putrescentiae]